MHSSPDQEPTHVADRRFALRIAAYAPAAVIAWTALYGAAAPGDSTWRAAVSPFAWHELVALHVAVVLPVGILVATLASGLFQRWPKWLLVSAGVTLGALIALWTVTGGEAAGLALDKVRAGFAVRWGVRVVWCFLLVLPWCVAAGRLIRQTGGDVDRAANVPAWALALFVAGGLPAVHALNKVREQTAQASQYVMAGRYWKAEPLIDALCDVGSKRPLASPADVRRVAVPTIARDELTAEVARHVRQIEQPMASDAAAEERVERANHLAAIGRLDEALAVVEPAAAENAEAAIMVAVVLDEQRRWQESHRWYRTAARLLSDSNDSAALRNLTLAYDGLAKTARDLERFRGAEAVYLEAIAAMPGSEAYFRFQLGRHYQLGGRPVEALASFQRAAALAPEQFALDGPLAAPHVRSLRQETPSCVLPVRATGGGNP